MSAARSLVLGLALLAAGRARALGPVEVLVRFEVDGLLMAPDTTFPRLPAGLPVALVPQVRMGGAQLDRARAEALGLSPRWLRLDPADPVTSNLQRDARTGATRLAATPLRWVASPLSAPDPWRVDADRLGSTGTSRFVVVVDAPGEPAVASTPGPNEQLELEPGVAGGMSPSVYGISRRTGETLDGVADELAGIPFLYHPLGQAPLHQTEARIGADCTSTFIYAMRRLGAGIPYRGPTSVWPHLQVLSPELRMGPDGSYRDPAGAPAAFRVAGAGDLVHFGRQLSMLVQDRWPFGVLDAHDLLLQAWRSPPRRVTVRDSEYADAAARLVRFSPELPRRSDAGLTVRVEDSHAASFFHLRPALAAAPATLVLLDAHSDAAPNPLAAELARHEPTADWARGLRDRGAVQAFDWVDALLAAGAERALWLGPWDEAAPAAEEQRAREDLCALRRRFPDRGFECRGGRFQAVRLEELLALPASTPVVLSIDLDFLLRRDGTVDPGRAAHLLRVLGHFTEVRGVSAALSRSYFPDDAAFERALRVFSAATWASGRVGAIEVDLAEEQREDRSLRAQVLRRAGIAPPVAHPEQIAATPGLHLAAARPFATFGLVGDVYLSEAGSPLPARLPFRTRPAWQPAERLPLLANLETPVVEDRPVAGHPTLNQHGELLDWLAAQGVLLVSLANNHALDQGPEGLRATIDAARAQGIGVVGAWLPGEPAQGVERLRIGDLHVAVLGVTYGLNLPRDGEGNVDVVPFEEYPPSAEGRAAEARFLAKVRRAGEETDLVVVLVHGGTEYLPGASVGQRRFFRALAAAGARVLAGAHAHVPAPWERAGDALVAWGLGDAVPRPRTSGIGLRVTAERVTAGLVVRAEEMPPLGPPPP